jgi:hypothetical protein
MVSVSVTRRPLRNSGGDVETLEHGIDVRTAAMDEYGIDADVFE